MPDADTLLLLLLPPPFAETSWERAGWGVQIAQGPFPLGLSRVDADDRNGSGSTADERNAVRSYYWWSRSEWVEASGD